MIISNFNKKSSFEKVCVNIKFSDLDYIKDIIKDPENTNICIIIYAMLHRCCYPDCLKNTYNGRYKI